MVPKSWRLSYQDGKGRWRDAIPHAQLHVPDVTPYEKEDIGETTDLYAKYPQVAKDIKRIMIEASPQRPKS